MSINEFKSHILFVINLLCTVYNLHTYALKQPLMKKGYPMWFHLSHELGGLIISAYTVLSVPWVDVNF